MAKGQLKPVGAKAMQPASPVTKLIPKAGPGAKGAATLPVPATVKKAPKAAGSKAAVSAIMSRL